MAQKEWLGQPWWVWAAGGVAVVGGYLYIRRQQSAASASQATPVYLAQTSATGLSTEQLLTWLQDQQGAPSPAATPAGKAPGNLYYHANPKGRPGYISAGGKGPVLAPSGLYSIGGRKYFFHAHPKGQSAPYFTYRGRRVKPPSGALTPA